MRETTAAGMEATIREYFDGCNEANAEKIMGCMEVNAVHYFPAGAPQGTFFGARAIADAWHTAVQNLGSIWTVDRVIADAPGLEAVIEWTHFKPKAGVYLRGNEWFIFSPAGLITEIKAYYACPASTDTVRSHEMGDFEYEQRGYPLAPPEIDR